MTKLLLRGRLLTFHEEPLEGEASADAYSYYEDGGLLLEDGKIAAIGDYAALRAGEGVEARRDGHRDRYGPREDGNAHRGPQPGRVRP